MPHFDKLLNVIAADADEPAARRRDRPITFVLDAIAYEIESLRREIKHLECLPREAARAKR